MAFLLAVSYLALIVPVALAACAITSDVSTILMVTAFGTPVLFVAFIMGFRALVVLRTPSVQRLREAWLHEPGTAKPVVDGEPHHLLLDAWRLLNPEVKSTASVTNDGEAAS